MKLSAAGSMSGDSCEPEVVPPEAEVKSEILLQELCINLCNLIVESRIPGINERGYGDGCHCPPLLGGPTAHKCDLAKMECQKHQNLIHNLLRAARSNAFEIEVLMLPDCCSEPKLSERLQNKEYVLLERWSMNCINCKGQSTIEVSQLLRAVRSFLHFSQISAWLSSTKGKSPANIYYWVKPSIDGSIEFEREPEVHSFPVCKIGEDLYGCVTVKYPARTQYVPIIPCSKHPPLRTYSFRTIENSNLCSNIPLNPQLVRQLQISCDTTTQSTPIARTFVPEPGALILSPVIIKTLSGKVSDENISNRILKRSNCQSDLISAPDLAIDLGNSNNMDVLSESQTSFVVCNYTQTGPQIQSREKVSYRKRQLAMHLHKKRLKLKKLNAESTASDSMPPSPNVCNLSVERITNEICDAPFHISNAVPSKLPFENDPTSPTEDFCNINTSLRKPCSISKKRKIKPFKRQSEENADTLPHKKVRCDTLDCYVSPSKTVFSLQNIDASHGKKLIPNPEKYNENRDRILNKERQTSFSILSPVRESSKGTPESSKSSAYKPNSYLKKLLANQDRDNRDLHSVRLKSKGPYNKLRRRDLKVNKDLMKSLLESSDMKVQSDSIENEASSSKAPFCKEVKSLNIVKKNKVYSVLPTNIQKCENLSESERSNESERLNWKTDVSEMNPVFCFNGLKSPNKRRDLKRKSKPKRSQYLGAKLKPSTVTSQLDTVKETSASNLSQGINTFQKTWDSGLRNKEKHTNSDMKSFGSTPKLTQILNQKATSKTVPFYHSSNAYRALLLQARNENLECFPKHTLKFPKSKKLLINFEESILKGCLPIINTVDGFSTEIGASGSFCPNHLTLPANVSFYDLGNTNQGAAPYVAHVELSDMEYFLPKKGAVQVTLFNPSDSVVKMFVLNYDLSSMPPLCHTFIRQKIYYLPVSKEENPQKSLKWLRFIIHLRFASTKTAKIYLHKDFKIVVLNKSNDDAASEFCQEPRELRSFLSVPMNPTYSSI